MPANNESSTPTSSQPQLTTPQSLSAWKQAWYGNFLSSQKRKSDLAHRVAAMAMDVPDDDMNIDASKRSTGITWKELAVIAATALSGYGIHSYFTKPPIPPSPPVTTTPAPDIPPDVPYSLEIDR